MPVPRTYFVTGATGAVGSALVPALIEDTEARIHLLIRARSNDDLQRRLDELFAFWQLGSDEGAARARVSALAGDVTESRFGLGEHDYRQLILACTHVIHSAGVVRMNLPMEEARRSSIAAAVNVVALARECQANGQLQKVEFVSTVGVLGRSAGILEEDWVTGHRQFHNTYETAKAEAEDYIRTEIAVGLPVTVHRPSMVVGNSRTGKIAHFQVFYHLCDFLSGRRTHGVYPDLGHMRLDTVPADFVGTAIAWYSRQEPTIGQIVHLCAGPEDSISLVQLKAMIASVLQKRGAHVPRPMRVSPNVFRTLTRTFELLVDDKTRRALRTLPVFLDYMASDPAFANTRTAKTLDAAGISRPAARDYLPKVLDYYYCYGAG